MPHKKPPVSPTKAKVILREGKIGGRKLTTKQKRFFGSIAGSQFGHPKRKRRIKR